MHENGALARFVGLWRDPSCDEYLLQLYFPHDGSTQSYRLEEQTVLEMFEGVLPEMQKIGWEVRLTNTPTVPTGSIAFATDAGGSGESIAACPTRAIFDQTPLFKVRSIRAMRLMGGGPFDGTPVVQLLLDPEDEESLIPPHDPLFNLDESGKLFEAAMQVLAGAGFEFDFSACESLESDEASGHRGIDFDGNKHPFSDN